jgi:hypothetical protein
MYEFYDKISRKVAEEERAGQEADKIEDKKIDDTLKWIEEEERKEQELSAKKSSDAPKESSVDDEKWMLEQLKKQHGDDFGEDIDLKF